VANALVVLAVGGVLLTGRCDSNSPTFFKLVVVAATLMMSVAFYFTHFPGSGVGFFYIWAAPYAYVFFSVRHAALQTAIVAACYAAVIVAESGTVLLHEAGWDAGRWLLTLGTIVAVGGFARVVTESMRVSELRFRRGFHDSSVGMALVSREGRFLEVNAALCSLLDYPAEELLSMSPVEVTDPRDVAMTTAALASTMEDRVSRHFEKRCRRSDGEVIWSRIDVSVVDDGARPYFIMQAQDVSEQKRAEEAGARQARQQAAVAELGRHALAHREIDLLFKRAVEVGVSILGIDTCSVLRSEPDAQGLRRIAGCGLPPGMELGGMVSLEPSSQAAYTLRTTETVTVEDTRAEARFTQSQLHRDLGVRCVLSAMIAGPRGAWGLLCAHGFEPRRFTADEADFVASLVNVLSNAVERHETDERVRHQALHDELTGLPNRALVRDRLCSALVRRRRDHGDVAVLAMDLDNFKVVNDSLGHSGGDELLMLVASRLSEAARATDTVARFGGDEFVVVCEGLVGREAALEVAERLLAAVSRPIALDDGEHYLTASIGIALATGFRDGAEELLRDADTAMYRAKEAGGGRCEVFDTQLRKGVLARMRIENEMRVALDRGEFLVYYQPILSARNRRVVAVEALARWEHPTRGLVPPMEFIPVSEETGLIVRLGRHVLETACEQVASWQRQYTQRTPMLLSVNVSARQIANPGFPAEAAAVAKRSGLAAGSLALEVTESVLIQQADAPVAALNAMRMCGLRLVLDDFGTGYSSLSYLQRFPLEALKIDRSFVRGLGEENASEAIVEAIQRMASSLGMTVVAEGVETEAQLSRVRELGCELVQGFLFAEPLPPDEFEQFLRRSHGVGPVGERAA